MEERVQSASPTRLAGLDLARGLALMGMVIVHFLMTMLSTAQAEASVLLTRLDGRPATLFMILAGIGASFMARARPEGATLTFIKRGIFLFVLGFANLILWQGDILRVYGLSFLLVPLFLRRSSWVLALIGIGFLVSFDLVFLFLDYGKNWDWETMTYNGIWTLSGNLRNLFFDGFRSVFPWTGLFILGMLLGRLDLRSPRTQWILFFVGAIACSLAEFSSRLVLETWSTDPFVAEDPELLEALTYMFGTGSMPPVLFFLVSSTGMALLVLGLCLIATARFPASRLLSAGSATGQLAFTWYLGHIYFGVFVIVALEFTTRQETTALLIALGYCLAMPLISLYWRSKRKKGPMESLLRRVSQGAAQ